MHFSCRSFVGHPSETFWSQFWEIEPDDPSLISHRGHLFGLINISASSNPAGILGRQLIDQINDYYYSSLEDDVPSRLTDTLNHFSQLPEYQSDSLSLILAVVSHDKVYLATYNYGHCILKRGDQISSLLVGQPDSVDTISGQILNSDLLFLCTDIFFKDFSWENIKSSLSAQILDQVEEDFLSRLHTLDNQSQLAGALIEMHTDLSKDSQSNYSESTQDISQPPDSPISPPIKPRKSLFSIITRLRPSYITHVDPNIVTKRKKLNILIAIIILIAFSISLFFGYRRNRSLDLENQYQNLKSQLEAKINNAQTIKSLNLTDALVESQAAYKILQEMDIYQGIHGDEINKYQDTVNKLLSQTGSADSYDPVLFFDTSLIDNGLSYLQLSLAGNSLYLLDSANGHIDKLDIVNKSHQKIITADNIKGTQFIAESNDVIFLLKDTEILAVDGTKLTSKINLRDQITDFNGGEIHFWNGGLYVLSIGSSSPSIWKYPPNATGFSPGINWLKSNQSLPLNSSSFAINGDIWVISKTGQITPYSLGVKKDFKSPESITPTNASNLITSLDSNYLAFTDKDSQIYVYDKSGLSVGQYNYGDKKILSLAYDSTSNTIFVLCNDKKIYQISL